jgi:asparaginyl-tRNA synthetase
MKRVNVKQALAGAVALGEEIQVEGWVRTRRDSKAGLSFIHLSDGAVFDPIQVVAPSSLTNYEAEVQRLTTGCSIRVRGTLAASQGQGQKFEVQASEIHVLGFVEDPEHYPVQPKAHTMEYLREIAHLRPRTNTFGAVSRVRHSAAQAVHRFFHERDFFWVNTPIVTASDAEGAGQMFRVSTLDLANLPRVDGAIDFSKDFFGRPTFLTVSGQLNVEAFCMALSRVYTFGPTFRAENSNTTRHLAEFWMIEPEIAFADLADDADLAEAFLKYIFQAVLTERADDMKFFAERIEKTAISRLEALIQTPFERIDYTEAIKILESAKKKKFEYPVSWGTDLQTEHERFLTEEHVGRPVIVMNYPEQIKAFYMRRNDDGRTVAAMDVLAPGIGEIIGGSQREERLDVLLERMKALHLDANTYRWYTDLRRFGTVPHAGFGLGFERLLVYITGMSNIRDVIPYPRAPGSADF